MRKVYAEIGIGNESFLSTEFEEGKKEWRVKGFKPPKKVTSFYIRIWIFKRVLVISFFNGMFLRKKTKNKFKFVLGLGGLSK